MKSRSNTSRRFRLPRGFSLPEVTLAIGILGFSMTALLGLIPSVLDNMRHASTLTAETRIVSEITASISLSDWGEPAGAPYFWSNLREILSKRWYFDDQGNPISPGDYNFDMRLTYVATTDLASEPGYQVTGNIYVPGENRSATPASPHAKAIHVRIATTTKQNFSFDEPSKYTTHLALIAHQY